jgi:uncharacterized protein (DUF1499 family)
MQRMTPDLARKVLGVQRDGRLSPCPDMPNCICSQYPQDKDHTTEPIAYSGGIKDAFAKIKRVMGVIGRTELVAESQNYLRFECTSFLFRFIDDVEFLIDPDHSVIHLRSASRLGYSDLGANRARVEKIKKLWADL